MIFTNSLKNISRGVYFYGYRIKSLQLSWHELHIQRYFPRNLLKNLSNALNILISRTLYSQSTSYILHFRACGNFCSFSASHNLLPSKHFYLFQINNRNTGKNCVICSKLTIKTQEKHHWRRSDVFIVN